MHPRPLFARLFLLFLTLTFVVLWTGTPVRAQEKAHKSLYERIGRYDAIAATMDDFVRRLTTDQQFSRFFTSFDANWQKRFRQILTEQACEALGGPCFFTGRDMTAAHESLRLTRSDWQYATKLMETSIGRLKISKSDKAQVLAALSKAPAGSQTQGAAAAPAACVQQ
jgi:hemoglobin